MTTPSAQRWPESASQRPTGVPPGSRTSALPPIGIPYLAMPIPRTFFWPARPLLVERAARAWWLSVGCWFLGSAIGQLMHSPAAWEFTYVYPAVETRPGFPRFEAWSLPGPLAIVVFGVVAVFLASLVFPMRDGARWARVVLTALAVPAELVLLRQIGASLFTGPATEGGIAQGILSMIGLCAIPGAVSMMYRPATRSYFHGGGRTDLVDKLSPPL